MEIKSTINGKSIAVGVSDNDLLVDLLRDGLGLTGTKRSCEVEVCGACTVLVDGNPVSSCMLLASEIDGSSVVTIEGTQGYGVLPSSRRDLHPTCRRAVRVLYARNPFDTPGSCLPRGLREPGHQEGIEWKPLQVHWISGIAGCCNRVARMTAMTPLRGHSEDYTVLGSSVGRPDTPPKMSGMAEFTGDLEVPGMLHGSVLRSPYAHALIKTIDVSAA